MKIGYARISTRKQKLSIQKAALKKFGCDKIIEEKKSVLEKREKLTKLLEELQEGDILVVWKLDRLGRDMFQLFSTLIELEKKGVRFISITENINTQTPEGKLMIAFASYMAEVERTLIAERREAGIELARRNGKLGGRPKGLSSELKKVAETACKMYLAKDHNNNYQFSISTICRSLNISKGSFYKILRLNNIDTKRGLEF